MSFVSKNDSNYFLLFYVMVTTASWQVALQQQCSHTVTRCQFRSSLGYMIKRLYAWVEKSLRQRAFRYLQGLCWSE